MATEDAQLRELLERLLAFRRERDWEQFHTPKNLAISISIEAAELLEHFQWTEGSEPVSKDKLLDVSEGLADILIYPDILHMPPPTPIFYHDFDLSDPVDWFPLTARRLTSPCHLQASCFPSSGDSRPAFESTLLSIPVFHKLKAGAIVHALPRR